MQHVTEIHYSNDTHMHVGRHCLSLYSAKRCTDGYCTTANAEHVVVQSQQQRINLPINFCALYNCAHVVAQLTEVLHYTVEGHRFDSQWCHWNFSLT